MGPVEQTNFSKTLACCATSSFTENIGIMCTFQSRRKIFNLQDTFSKHIELIVVGYHEGRVRSDRYI